MGKVAQRIACCTVRLASIQTVAASTSHSTALTVERVCAALHIVQLLQSATEAMVHVICDVQRLVLIHRLDAG